MDANKIVPVAVLVLILALSACGNANTESAIQTGVAQTQQISELQTAAAGNGEDGNGQEGNGSDEETPEDQDTEGPTETASITPTPTSSIPLVSVSVDTNCRSGPSVNFGQSTTILAGEEVEVLYISPNPDYVVVQRPGGSGSCWLWLRYADRTDFSPYNLPVATLPPTPTPTNTPIPYEWEATWSICAPTCGFTMPVSVSGNTFSSTWNDGSGDIVMTGTISENGQSVSGSYTYTAGPNGTFQFQIKSGNINQFVGNGNSGGFAWCGSKNGASPPSPCKWP